MPQLFAALKELEDGSRSGHVRIVWLGDSHTQADFWTHPLRRALQKRFGNGGPGFVHAGLRSYRHSAFSFEVEGGWSREPLQPSHVRRQEDGVFGLGGMRTVPRSPGASVEVKLRPGAAVGAVRWEVTYRLPAADDAFDLELAGKPAETIRGKGEPGVMHVKRSAAPTESLALRARSGSPQIFGVIAESSKPGVVVDTLGINGARIGTPLAWDEKSWTSEVARREPVLVIFAYGTNEIVSSTSIDRYPDKYRALLARIRTVAPSADCVMIGPTDLAKPDWTTHPRAPEMDEMERKTAAELGCVFFSVFDAMGRHGSFYRWFKEKPPLAHSDRIHLKPAGYEKIGKQIAKTVLDGYRRWKAGKNR